MTYRDFSLQILLDIFSELRYSMMPEFLIPDIKRHQLEDIILNIKSLDIKQDRVEKFMKLLIEPPEPIRVASALKVLEGVGALDPEQKVCKMNSLYQIRSKMLHGTKVIIYI